MRTLLVRNDHRQGSAAPSNFPTTRHTDRLRSAILTRVEYAITQKVILQIFNHLSPNHLPSLPHTSHDRTPSKRLPASQQRKTHLNIPATQQPQQPTTMGFTSLLPLVILFTVVGGAAYFGYQIYLWSNDLADRGQKHMEKKNMSFTKEGGLKVGVKEMDAEEYADRTQR